MEVRLVVVEHYQRDRVDFATCRAISAADRTSASRHEDPAAAAVAAAHHLPRSISNCS